MTFEPFAGLRYIRARLIQDATLAGLIGTRVYFGVAPSGAATPHIVVSFVAATDRRVVNAGAERVWTELLWQVEAWSRTADPAVVAQIADRIDAVLDGASGTVTGASYGAGTVWVVTRQGPLMLNPEVEGDVVWNRAGGEYRQTVQAA